MPDTALRTRYFLIDDVCSLTIAKLAVSVSSTGGGRCMGRVAMMGDAASAGRL